MTERIPEPAPTNPEDLEIELVLEGPVEPAARAEAERVIQHLTSKVPRPVIFARVKLTVNEARPDEEQAIAQATVDVSGAIIRAQVAAPTERAAVDALGERLDRRMRRVAERRETARDRPPSSPEGEWRRGDLPSSRPGFFPRPPEERRIVRRKSFTPHRTSVEEALFDLDVLDYRFFLFTDEADGSDSIVYEADNGVMLRRVSGGTPPPHPDRPLTIEVNETPAPEIAADEAIERLNVSHEPFILFRDSDSGRGAVVYRRYDGHYGVVEPAP